MAIDYRAVRAKVNELNRSAIKIVDMMTMLEGNSLFGEPLTQVQVDGMKSRLKTEADNLKSIAGEIKTLVS